LIILYKYLTGIWQVHSSKNKRKIDIMLPRERMIKKVFLPSNSAT
jgi:hypothetical protein